MFLVLPDQTAKFVLVLPDQIYLFALTGTYLRFRSGARTGSRFSVKTVMGVGAGAALEPLLSTVYRDFL